MTSRRTPRTAAASRTTARITGPLELLQAVPYLLGFRPWASLVLVGLRESGLVVTARTDLGDVERDTGLLGTTLRSVARADATAVVGAVFDDAGPEQPAGFADHTLLAARMQAAADAADVAVLDVLQVAGGRWRSALCTDPACCPADGEPLPATTPPFVAAATVDGIAPLADRAALAECLAPAPDAERAALEPAIAAAESAAVQAVLDARERAHRRAAVRALFSAARASDRLRWSPPAADESAGLAVALTDVPVRDSVWMGVDDRRLDGRALWLHLARHLPSPYDAPPLFLYAWAEWRAGNGAAASMAAHRALDSDPSYTAADLLVAALAHGVDPRRLPRLRLPRTA